MKRTNGQIGQMPYFLDEVGQIICIKKFSLAGLCEKSLNVPAV
jgi:hypothetical protein